MRSPSCCNSLCWLRTGLLFKFILTRCGLLVHNWFRLDQQKKKICYEYYGDPYNTKTLFSCILEPSNAYKNIPKCFVTLLLPYWYSFFLSSCRHTEKKSNWGYFKLSVMAQMLPGPHSFLAPSSVGIYLIANLFLYSCPSWLLCNTQCSILLVGGCHLELVRKIFSECPTSAMGCFRLLFKKI